MRKAAGLSLLVCAAAVGSRSAARLIRGPYLQSAPAGSARIVWYTDEPTETSLEWRFEKGIWAQASTGSPPARRHEVSLGPLKESASYGYRIPGSPGDWSFRAPSTQTLKLVAFGDTGTGAQTQMDVASAVARESPLPDLVLHTGDVIYPHGAAEDYDSKFFAPYAGLLPQVPFYAVVGNHDYETAGARPYLDVFSLPQNGPRSLRPETVYSFDAGGVHFVVHDSNLDEATLYAVVTPWHVLDMRRAGNARYRIAALHHSPYSSGLNAPSYENGRARSFFPPLFSRTGVDLVLGGHDHVYERTHVVDGVVYVTTGAGGAALYPKIVPNPYSDIFYGAGGGRHSFTTLEVSGPNLRLRQTDITGCVVDQLGLYKPLSKGDPLRVLLGRSPPPSDWTRAEFNDAAWLQVAAPVGRASPDVAWNLPGNGTPFVTVYGRATFALADGVLTEVNLRIRYDDGFVAYVNGVEVARRNVPEGQRHDTGATSRHAGDRFEAFALPTSVLRIGTNVLAIEVHNVSANDSSFLFEPELTLVGAEPGRCP